MNIQILPPLRLIKILAIFSIILISFQSQAQFGNQQVISSCVVCGTKDITTADIDGDGDLDVISTSHRDQKLVWLENDGTGQFENHSIIAYEIVPVQSIAVADIDNDGDQDVISVSGDTWDGFITWYQNDGDGIFIRHEIASYDNNVYSVQTADFDQDGNIDIIVNKLYTKLLLFKNLGNGIFGPEQVLSTDSRYSYPVDLDGDGYLDIVSTDYSNGKIKWLKNNGSGGFDIPEIEVDNLTDPTKIYSEDLDADGDSDLLLIYDSRIAWYQNLGDGTFGNRQTITTNANFALALIVTDMDGDLDLDVVSSSSSSSKVVWYENDGNGVFASQTILNDEATTADGLHAADLDMDGDSDIFSVDDSYNYIKSFLNDGNGVFDYNTISDVEANYARDIDTADFDADGDMDILCSSSAVGWYKNMGNDVFELQKISSRPAKDISSVDLDMDGDLDVVAAHYSNSDKKIAWYENDGTGTFGDQIVIANTQYSDYIEVKDLDGDLDIDIISVGEDSIVWHQNLGNGIFENPVFIGSMFNINKFESADIDGDGDIDIIASGPYSIPRIVWYENDGNGGFTTVNVVTEDQAYEVRTTDIADINNDGFLDVITGNSGGDIAWFKNDGNGVFENQMTISNLAYSCRSVYAADMDNDGDIDVISASGYLNENSEIAWYENLGNGDFGDQNIISTQAFLPQTVFAADLDGDNDLEVISTSSNDAKVAWYENLSTTATHVIANTTINIFPNPTSQYINIKLEKSFDFELSLYDLSGKLILRRTNENQIDISNFSSGTYFMQIDDLDSGQQIFEKIIVAKPIH